MIGTEGQVNRMSDDLISRKVVLKELREILNEPHNTMFLMGIGAAVTIIEHCETAFDKEKLIEDLNDWMKDAEKWAAKYDEVGDTDNMDLQDMAARCYKNAIEIVEKGGIE